MKNFNSRFARVIVGVSLAVALALTVGSVGLNFWFVAEAHRADAERRDTTAALISAQDEYRDLYEEYTSVTGDQPDSATPNQLDNATNNTKSTPGATGATGSPGPQGPRGLMGLPGQTGATGAKGEDGAPGAKGKDGSNGKDGASGANGKDGANGADSTVPGPTGPVGPVGPAGATGAAGTNGVDGRGIQSMTCSEDGSWYITYTDGTAMSTPGPCRVTLLP